MVTVYGDFVRDLLKPAAATTKGYTMPAPTPISSHSHFVSCFSEALEDLVRPLHSSRQLAPLLMLPASGDVAGASSGLRKHHPQPALQPLPLYAAAHTYLRTRL